MMNPLLGGGAGQANLALLEMAQSTMHQFG